MIEAKYYEKLADKVVKCHICPNECEIKKDRTGYCQVRTNIEGVLYTTTYNKVSIVAIDPIEKKPLFHFYPGKDILSLSSLGCNMRCKHCIRYKISQPDRPGAKRVADTFTAEDMIETAQENQCDMVAWTYNEPVVWYEYVLDSLKAAKEAGLKTVIVTNGYINLEPLKEWAKYIDAMSIDLKAFSETSYKNLTDVNGLEAVKKTIKWVHAQPNIHLEIVTNVVTTMNDSEAELKALAKWIKDELGDKVPWHITSFTPMLDLHRLDPTPLETIEMAVRVGKEAGLKYVYTGNLIYNEHENTYCPKCSETLIHRVYPDVLTKNYTDHKCNNCGVKVDIIDV